MLGRRIPHNLVQTKSCMLSQVVVQIMVNQKASEGYARASWFFLTYSVLCILRCGLHCISFLNS